MGYYLPVPVPLSTSKGEETGTEKPYRVAYAVHEILQNSTDDTVVQADEEKKHPLQPTPASGATPQDQKTPATRFIGLVNLTSLSPTSLVLPDHLSTPPSSTSTPILTVEIAYSFLPAAWGKGYATETVKAALEACKKAGPRGFWAPYTKVYVRSIVNETNPRSLRVMEKSGMVKRGIYEWSGKAVFIAGEWIESCELAIFGMFLLE